MSEATPMGWRRRKEGSYTYRSEHCEGMVILEGELWSAWTYYEGDLIDFARWEGRDVAFRNVERAAKNAVRIHSPCAHANRRLQQDEEEDDD